MSFFENFWEKYFLRIKFKMLSLRKTVFLILIKLGFVKSDRSCGKTRSFLFIIMMRFFRRYPSRWTTSGSVGNAVNPSIFQQSLPRDAASHFHIAFHEYPFLCSFFMRTCCIFLRYVSSQISAFLSRKIFYFNFDLNISFIWKIQIFMWFYFGEFESSFVDSNPVFSKYYVIIFIRHVQSLFARSSRKELFKNLIRTML